MHRDILTIEEKIQLARKRSVYTEYELDVLIPAFLSNKEFDKVNREKQNKHIVGTYECNEADAKSKRLGFAGSAFFNTDFNICSEINKIRGTGLINFNNCGFPIGETIKFHKKIGFGGRDKLINTDVIAIRYSATGTHAFPVDPEIYEKERVRKQKTCIGLTTRHISGVSRTGFVYKIQSFFKKVKALIKP